MNNFLFIENELKEIVNVLDFKNTPTEYIDGIKDLINAGEYGVASENIISIIFDFDISVDIKIKNRIINILDMMNMDQHAANSLIVQEDILKL